MYGYSVNTATGVILYGPDTMVPPYGPNYAQVSIVAEEAGTLTFSWHYWTTDNAYWDTPSIVVDGVRTILFQGNEQDVYGSFTTYVNLGSTVSFRLDSLDSCCGAGIVEIYDATWVPDQPDVGPPPEEPSPVDGPPAQDPAN